MSVPAGKRKTSEIEFEYNAKILDTEICKLCMKLPKSMRFLKTQRLAQMSMDAYFKVLSANKIYPTNAHEVQLRRDYFHKALCMYYFLAAQIEVLEDINGVPMQDMKKISGILKNEINLVKGVMDSDKRRFSKLK